MKLSDIASIYDCPHSTAPDEGEGYPLIRTPNVGKGRLILDNVHRVSKATYDIRNKRAVPQEDDIIFAREAPAGNAAVITKGQYVCLGQRTVLIRPNPEMIDSHYFVYYLLSPHQQVKLFGFSHGATVGHVNIPDIANMTVDLPELSIQKKVSKILENYDNLIEINNKRIKTLEQMAENLYKEWFVRFRFPGHEPAEFENGIPKGWHIKRLRNYGRIETGKTPSTEALENYGDEIMFVKTPDMHSNTFVIQTEECLSQIGHQTQPKKLLPRKSVMVTCIGSGGIVALNAEQAHTNQQINSIIPDNPIYLEWLFYSCKNLKETIEMYGATGTTMTNLSKGKFERLKVIEPTEVLIASFHRIVNPILINIEQLSYINKNLIKQRDLLLPRLMSGKLEVK